MKQATRGKQVAPTKEEYNRAWAKVRARADAGDLLACALVVALTGDKQQIAGSVQFIKEAVEIGERLAKKIQGMPDETEY